MPKIAGKKKERHHVQLSAGLWNKLTELYATRGISNSHVIDSLVSMHLRQMEEEITKVKEEIDVDTG